jgi:GR25 family glycosyltransferase involved in LPS biosynthesis
MEQQFQIFSINENIVERIEAYYIPENGSIGCAKSHILTLNKIKQNGYKISLVLEDDFEILSDKLIESINDVANSNLEWDIIMLSGNVIQYENTNHSNLIKINEAQTTSGYLININFVDKLIENFEESISLLESGTHKDFAAIDQNWKKLQPISKWFSFDPRLGKQRDDYSDIEKKIVSYKC